mgnify:CR=1 FL=1
MNVGELVRALQTVDQAAPVEAEGCDCVDDVVGVSLMPDGIVMLRRSSGWLYDHGLALIPCVTPIAAR